MTDAVEKSHKLLRSRISGFSRMTPQARRELLASHEVGSVEALDALLKGDGLSTEQADIFIENCIGVFQIPFGIALNFVVDGEPTLVPMAVEESSVVAAASHGAKLAGGLGGFFSDLTKTIATSQIEFFVDDERSVEGDIRLHEQELRAIAESVHPRLVARGGGVRSIECRRIASGRFVLHLNVDTLEAMGANIVNTMAEEVGCHLPRLVGCRVGLRILTNLTTHRLTRVHCEVEPSALEFAGFSGEDAVDRIVRAWEFANLDPFRAATHNKGVMNGIDPVVIATGNDWRAVEAGCHAFASLSGRYAPLTRWCKTSSGRLRGEITVPVAVGTVGGVTRLHPQAKLALRILGNPDSARLSALIASVGLAQNLSALRALACEGIQKGHMSLHQKNLDMLRRYDDLPQLSSVSKERQ
jgi:hydroxymethylglutaryl-CoA reductase